MLRLKNQSSVGNSNQANFKLCAWCVATCIVLLKKYIYIYDIINPRFHAKNNKLSGDRHRFQKSNTQLRRLNIFRSTPSLLRYA